MDDDLDVEQPHAGGAGRKLTVERQQRICDAVRAGVRPEIAAVYCGVSARTYYRWMHNGRGHNAEETYIAFAAAVEVALAEWETRDILLIGEAAKDDWHAAAWRLERRLPKVYGRRERHDIANADEGSFRIAAIPYFDPDKLSVAELEQLIELTEKASPDDAEA